MQQLNEPSVRPFVDTKEPLKGEAKLTELGYGLHEQSLIDSKFEKKDF